MELFKKILDKCKINIKDTFKEEILHWEKCAMTKMNHKSSIDDLQRVPELKRMRTNQNANAKTTHFARGKHDDNGVSTNKAPRKRRKQSTCANCGQLGHRKNSKKCPKYAPKTSNTATKSNNVIPEGENAATEGEKNAVCDLAM